MPRQDGIVQAEQQREKEEDSHNAERISQEEGNKGKKIARDFRRVFLILAVLLMLLLLLAGLDWNPAVVTQSQ